MLAAAAVPAPRLAAPLLLAPAPVPAASPAAGGALGGDLPPVAAVAGAAAGADAAGADLSRRPARQARAPEEDSAARRPVLALIRQAELVCRIANGAGPAAPRAGYGFAVAQAQAGLVVRGQLVVETEAGLRVGSGRIYRAGELIAAFAGPNLAFMDSRRLDRRL